MKFNLVHKIKTVVYGSLQNYYEQNYKELLEVELNNQHLIYKPKGFPLVHQRNNLTSL